MSDLPKFIPRDGQLLAVPPISMKTTVYLFLLEADWDKLSAMVDLYLNQGGSKTVYKPLLPSVMLYCSYAKSAPTGDPIGWCPEKDFGFWVPVVAGHVEGGLFIPERILTFTPYLWVDSGVAMVGGREVYGFPKEIGTLTMPKKTTDPATFTVDTLVIPKYGKDAEVVERPLLEVAKRNAGVWEELVTLWRSGEAFLGSIEEIIKGILDGKDQLPIVDPAFIIRMIKELGHEMPMVFLKQFPDIRDGTRACYQAVVEAPVKITSGITGGWLPGEYGITIQSYDSHRIVENLGLNVAEQHGDSALMKSLVHWWVEFDALVDNGTIIWQKP